MTYIFSPEEKQAARRERKILLSIWIVTAVVYVAAIVTLVTLDIYFVEIHRDRSHFIWMTIVSVLLTALFGGFSLFFFSIKFRLTNKYCRMLRDMDRGLKDQIEATFVGYDENVSMKDGVFFYSMVLKAKPLKREDISERKVLIEHTVKKPELVEGQRLNIVSHANILISYELLGNKIIKEEEKI